MGILFRHKNPLSSVEFNKRFADGIGKSIFRGFYFRKGTNPLDISITSDSFESSLLITKTGVRVELEEDLKDVVTLNPNNFTSTRIDMIYVKYEHGNQEAIIEITVAEGEEDEALAYAESEDTHTLIGYVHLPAGTSDLANATFEYPERGIHLKDVANKVTFKDTVTFEQGISLPAPTENSQGATKEYVDNAILEGVHEALPYESVISNTFNETSQVFEEVLYKRKDGTVFLKTTLSDLNANDFFETITLSRYEEDGVTLKDTEDWTLTYNEFGNIISKLRV